ncbi:hypothetical protein QUA56_11195 [Microcoleus sp. N3A4]|uniref:hypothetical protein n=1 Tax=Microcoleus sp. N3A4 TaxID=3055379 RepID=UPI002FD4691C
MSQKTWQKHSRRAEQAVGLPVDGPHWKPLIILTSDSFTTQQSPSQAVKSFLGYATSPEGQKAMLPIN